MHTYNYVHYVCSSVHFPIATHCNVRPTLLHLCIDMLREGDELLEVNGISVTGMRTDEVIRLMVSLSGEGLEGVARGCDWGRG